jgi:hypothetical protein
MHTILEHGTSRADRVMAYHIAPRAMIQCIDMASRTFVVSSLGYALR